MVMAPDRLPFLWELGFSSLSSGITLVGTHHVLDRNISGLLEPLMNEAATVVIEHPLITGVSEGLPFVAECIGKKQIDVVREILGDLGWPGDIDGLRVDEAVALVQRAAYSSLGENFHVEQWVEEHARETGKHITYAETVEQRDEAAAGMYIAYLESLTSRDALMRGIRESLDNYWNRLVEAGGDIGDMELYERGVRGRSVAMMEHLVFELMRRDNLTLAFLGTLHCIDIHRWLSDPDAAGRIETTLSPKVLAGISMVRR